MLSVVAWLAPYDGCGFSLHGFAGEGQGLAVALHLELLQISGKTTQALVVRQHSQRRQSAEVDVPSTKQRHQSGQVLPPRRRAKLLVHLMRTTQKRDEIFAPDGNRQRHSDGRPDGI